MIKRIALLTSVVIMMILLLSNIPVLAADAGSGVIKGKLVNATANTKSSVGNIDMKLNVFLNGAQKDSPTAKTDADGNYVFSGLATDSKYSYQVTVTYQEADYQSDEVSFGKDETTKVLDLKVYDATAEDIIKVDVIHTLVTPGEGSLKVEQYITFNNDTDKAYVGSKTIPADPTKKETIRFALPKGAANVSYDSGLMSCCVFTGGDGFVYGMAVFPGKLDVDYSYELPYKSTEFTYTDKFEYATPQYNFLIQGGGVTATSDQLTSQPPVNVQGKSYNLLAGGNLAAGNTVSVKLAGLTPAGNQNALLFVGLGVVVIGGGAGGLYTLRKRKLQPRSGPVGAAIPSRQSRQSILAEIAQLDDDFEAGKINERWYRTLRAQKKAELATTNRSNAGSAGRTARRRN